MIAAPSAVGTVLSIGGVLLGVQIVSYLSMGLLALWLGLCVVVLAIDRRAVRRSLREKDDVLRAYGNSIRSEQEADQDLFHTASWDEEVSISGGGDAVIIRKFILKTNTRPVRAIWTLAKRNSDAHLSPATRDAVRVSAHYLNADGRTGSRIVTTKAWEHEGRLRVYMHFDRPLAPATEVNIQLKLEWPKYARDALDGLTDVVHWTARRPTARLSSSHTYEKSYTKKTLAITALDGTPEPTVVVDATNGTTKIHLDLDEIEVDREYGYRVSLSD
ncbi:hypothetical protein [Microbacterium sp. NPDC077184]|uniref:hypothetical protein n=1 Tax=Microbacterium sp. NPDC077184 TaxID=3154764 RepID=UPI003425E9BB